MDTVSTITDHISQLIWGDENDQETLEHEIELLDSESASDTPTTPGGRPSLYIRIFEDMIQTVSDHERHLLTDREWDIFDRFAELNYNSRYCLTRLLLRKPAQWHALSALEKYKREVSEQGLVPAITELCEPLSGEPESTHIDAVLSEEQEDELEVVDLTLDSDDDNSTKPTIHDIPQTVPLLPTNAIASSSRLDETPTPDGRTYSLEIPSNSTELNLDFFCEDERKMSLSEILGRLTVDQLKELVKMTKSKPRKLTKPEMISALIMNASTQSILHFSPSRKCKSKEAKDGLRQTTLPFCISSKQSKKQKGKAPAKNQEARLRQMALNILGKCVRVNYDFYRLVRRLHIICFRSTQHPASILLPAILASFRKRTYPEYKFNRDSDIWSTREELLKYEEAMELEARIDEALDSRSSIGRETKTPVAAAAGRNAAATPATPGMTTRGRSLITPAKAPRTPRCVASVSADTPKWAKKKEEERKVDLGTSALRKVKKEEAEEEERMDVEIGAAEQEQDMEEEEEEKPPETAAVQKARAVKKIFDEVIYQRWKDLVAVKQEHGLWERTPGLERFEHGYIYTRLVHKAVHALAQLKEHTYEEEVLNALLAQRLWRRGKRAKYYDRRALIQTRYLCFDEHGKKDNQLLERALNGVKEALLDEDTGIVLRPCLVRRLILLEKKLKIPEEERSQSEGQLKAPPPVFVKAVRVKKRAESLQLDASGRVIKGGKNVEAYFSLIAKPGDAVTPVVTKKKVELKTPVVSKWSGRPLWVGKDNEEVNVETRALQYYESNGFKGFHSETRILTTIFALLFWDIIFSDVRGAFETPYQSAPLDMTEDTFYYARKELIEARLIEIKDGKAREIVERHDEKYRDKGTWCIGVRWDICQREDLVDIVELLGGNSLAIICRLFCEDYGGRSSGVPDLIVWSVAKGVCKFVEVKGPGDRPQENQKLWFDSLLGAGTHVEICRVLDIDAPKSEKPKRKRNATATAKSRKKARPTPNEPESEEDSHEGGESRRKRAFEEGDDDDELPVFSSSRTSLAGCVSENAGVEPPRKKRRKMAASHVS